MRKTLFTEAERQALRETTSPPEYAAMGAAREATSSLLEASYPEQAEGGRKKWEEVSKALKRGFKPVCEQVYRQHVKG